jgi:hypothetical protein
MNKPRTLTQTVDHLVELYQILLRAVEHLLELDEFILDSIVKAAVCAYVLGLILGQSVHRLNDKLASYTKQLQKLSN